MLKVKKLDPRAKLPTVAHPHEDLGYDVYALEDTGFEEHRPTKIRTGIAIAQQGYGFIVKDRSSLASLGIFTHAGVIDAGYRGEVIIVMSSMRLAGVKAGDKIAQLIPVKPRTKEIYEVEELPSSDRGEKGFGSSGK